MEAPEYDVSRMDAAGTMVLAVTLLAAGVFLGIEFTARLALASHTGLEAPPWLSTVETARYLAVGTVTAGFAVLVYLQFSDE